MPMTKEKAEPKVKLMSLKALKSTTGTAALNERQKNTTAPTTMTIANLKTVSSCSQSYCGPSSSTYSSEPRNAAMPASPTQSKRLKSEGFPLSKSISVQAAAVTRMPGTMLTRNSACQEKAWLR